MELCKPTRRPLLLILLAGEMLVKAVTKLENTPNNTKTRGLTINILYSHDFIFSAYCRTLVVYDGPPELSLQPNFKNSMVDLQIFRHSNTHHVDEGSTLSLDESLPGSGKYVLSPRIIAGKDGRLMRSTTVVLIWISDVNETGRDVTFMSLERRYCSVLTASYSR